MPELHFIFQEMERLGAGRTLLQPGQWAVYALVDPRDQTMRYIGVTKHPERREVDHYQDEENNQRKIDWIAGLRAAGLRPIMRQLEVVDGKQAAEAREAQWIAACLDAGMELLNISSRPRPVQPALTIPRPARQSGPSESQRAEIIRLYQAGISVTVIARKVLGARGGEPFYLVKEVLVGAGLMPAEEEQEYEQH
jgi:hypothetical protein